MALTVEKIKREWIVSSHRPVSIYAVAENGKVGSAQINGVNNDVICIDSSKLQPLWHALTETLQEIKAVEERTGTGAAQ